MLQLDHGGNSCSISQFKLIFQLINYIKIIVFDEKVLGMKVLPIHAASKHLSVCG